MKLSRAQFLGGAAAAMGGMSLTGCVPALRHLSAPELPARLGQAEAGAHDPAWRVLNRMAYGPRPGDLERVRAMGVDAFVEEQLAPERIPERWAAWMRLLPMDTLNMDAEDAEDYETAVFPEVGKGQAAVELQQACLLRAVYSSRQLEQVMVEFWTDHFNVSQLKQECSWLKTVDDRLIRKHALGKFRDLVSASARSAAMLFYLDNDKNRKLDPATHSGPNENYARELLELHTLGVKSGYSLKDIQEVARCLSGWSYKKGLAAWPGDFEFHAAQHDDGPKRVLGVAIPPGQGIKDGAVHRPQAVPALRSGSRPGAARRPAGGRLHEDGRRHQADALRAVPQRGVPARHRREVQAPVRLRRLLPPCPERGHHR
jgi:uncharacterized protein (DUF1800 family)